MLAFTSQSLTGTAAEERVDARAEILSLFDGGPRAGLALHFVGEQDRAEEDASLAELYASLAMHDESFRASRSLTVDPPDAASIARGLAVLGEERVRRGLLDRALSTFGRKLLDPLAILLHASEPPADTRLQRFRDIVTSQARELGMTHATTQMLLDDLRRLLDDGYLRALAECEENVQRPRVQKLTQDALRSVGKTFHRALERWLEDAPQLAEAIASRMTEPLSLKDSPAIIRGHVVDAIEEFLWLETGAELATNLSALLAAHADVVGNAAVKVDRRLYRDFAEACWRAIEEAC